MSRVVILEPEGYNPEALALYGELGSVSATRLEGEARRAALRDAEVIVIRLGDVRADLLAEAPNLKVIASPTTGLNHIDLAEVERRGIRIVSLKGRRDITEKIYATSEHTIALLLALLRHIPAAHAHVLNGGWDRQQFIGTEVSGKTIGIVGCGRLGSRVATILQAMGATVIAADPHQPSDHIPAGVLVVSLLELLSRADIVSLHVDLSDETTGMFDETAFAAMKPGAYVINTSRGQIVQEAALLHALESGHLAGAAIDVLNDESGDAHHLRENPLRAYAQTHGNLIITPHLGGATRESMGLTEIAIAREVLAVLKP